MVVLKELIMNSWYFGRLCGPERTDFEQFLHWDSVEVLTHFNRETVCESNWS